MKKKIYLGVVVLIIIMLSSIVTLATSQSDDTTNTADEAAVTLTLSDVLSNTLHNGFNEMVTNMLQTYTSDGREAAINVELDWLTSIREHMSEDVFLAMHRLALYRLESGKPHDYHLRQLHLPLFVADDPSIIDIGFALDEEDNYFFFAISYGESYEDVLAAITENIAVDDVIEVAACQNALNDYMCCTESNHVDEVFGICSELCETSFGNQEVAPFHTHSWRYVASAANGCMRRCTICNLGEVTAGHGIGSHRNVSATHHDVFCTRCGWVHDRLPHTWGPWVYVGGGQMISRCTESGCTGSRISW